MLKDHEDIQPILASDLDSIHQIDLVTNSNPWSLKNLTDSIINFHLGYLIKHQHKTVAFIIFANQLDFTEILLLATLPNHQRQNYASHLLQQLITYNQQQNIAKILLEVRKSNTMALNFYSHRGFKIIHERKNYYQNPLENALVMEKYV